MHIYQGSRLKNSSEWPSDVRHHLSSRANAMSPDGTRYIVRSLLLLCERERQPSEEDFLLSRLAGAGAAQALRLNWLALPDAFQTESLIDCLKRMLYFIDCSTWFAQSGPASL